MRILYNHKRGKKLPLLPLLMCFLLFSLSSYAYTPVLYDDCADDDISANFDEAGKKVFTFDTDKYEGSTDVSGAGLNVLLRNGSEAPDSIIGARADVLVGYNTSQQEASFCIGHTNETVGCTGGDAENPGCTAGGYCAQSNRDGNVYLTRLNSVGQGHVDIKTCTGWDPTPNFETWTLYYEDGNISLNNGSVTCSIADATWTPNANWGYFFVGNEGTTRRSRWEVRNIYDVSSSANNPPPAPSIIAPTTNDVFGDYNVYGATYLNWTSVTDPDGDPVVYHYCVQNSTDDVLGCTGTNLTSNTTQLNFGNPASIDEGSYNVTVEACDDSELCTNSTSIVIIADYTDPIITWNNPLSDNSSLYYEIYNISLNFTATDDNLFSMEYNISKNANMSNQTTSASVTDINTTSYTLANYYNFNVSGTGRYYTRVKTCDGHTANEITEFYQDKDDLRKGLVFSNFIIFPQSLQVEDYYTTKRRDRYSVTYKTRIGYDKTSYLIASDDVIHIVSRTDYRGHLVIGDKWIDFEELGLISAKIVEDYVSGYNYAVRVDLTFKEEQTEFNFNSVGELNCVTENGYFTITLIPPTYVYSGISCPEKYADNKRTISFSGDPGHNCTLRNNELVLLEDTNCSLSGYNFNGTFGRNLLEMEDDNGSSWACYVTMGKADFQLGDFLQLLIWVLVFAMLIWLATKTGAKFLLLLAGIVMFMLGFSLFAIHWLLGFTVMIGALIMFIGLFK